MSNNYWMQESQDARTWAILRRHDDEIMSVFGDEGEALRALAEYNADDEVAP
jgi:hypothetical protein